MLPMVQRVAFSMLIFSGLYFTCSRCCGQAQDTNELLESARAAQSAGNYSDAATDYARAAALEPNLSELWSNCGVMEYMAGQMEASAASLKHALQLNPDLFVPMLFLGKAYVRLGKPARALPYLDHAHAIQPGDVEVLLTLAKANVDLGRERQAISFYADAAKIDPKNTVAWFRLGVSSLDVITADGRKLATTQAQSPWARALHAEELLVQGRPVEATDRYRTALNLASPSEKATLIHVLNWMQSHPDLYPLPPNSQAALQRLIAEFGVGQSKTASPACELTDSKKGPDIRRGESPVELLDGAACAYWAGDYQRSSVQAGQVLRRSPLNAEALYWSIKANEQIAVAALSRFEELDPRSSKNYVMVGDLYRYQRQMDSALKEYKKALTVDPQDLSALMGAADAYFENGNLDEAAALDKAALSQRPQDPQLNLLMADIFAEKNQYDLAKPYLANCLNAPPELQSRVHALLGRVAVEEGNTNRAIRQFELALPGDKDGSVHYQLARLYRKTGQQAKMEKAEAEAKILIAKRNANATIVIREVAAPTP